MWIGPVGALLIAIVSLHLGCQPPKSTDAFTETSGHAHASRNMSDSPARRPIGGAAQGGSAEPIEDSVLPSRVVLAGLSPIVPRAGRSKPVVAVVGVNSGTEVTDYVVPYAILAASGAADVWSLGTRPGPIRLFPALTVEPHATVSAFDRRFPQGADVVIVPAVHDDDDPELLAWVTAQADRGATIVGICDGVWVLARAGLLAGRRGVGHWYSMGRLGKRFPETTWVRDQRFIADGRIVTTTGVTASAPVSIALVEALAGHATADSLAKALGVRSWSPSHDSDHFSLGMRHVRTAAANWLAFWRREEVGIPVQQGVDEITLALTADAYSRTYRSEARTIAAMNAPVTTKRGLIVLPDLASPELVAAASTPQPLHPTLRTSWSHVHVPVAKRNPVDYLAPLWEGPPVRALDVALDGIAQRYGPRTSAFVALQLEYTP